MSDAPKILGIMSIVFGGLVALWSPVSFFMSSFMRGLGSLTRNLPKQPGVRDPSVAIGAAQAMIDAQRGYLTVHAVVMIAMSIALILVGVGLLKRKAWARQGAIVWSVLGLLFLLGQSVTFFTWLQPTMEAARDGYYQAQNVPPPPREASLQHVTGTIGALFGWFLYAIYPVVLLVVLGRKSMAAELTP